LRTQGISVSQGEIVALLEDDGRVDEKWCEEIKKAHALPYAAIGGSVEPDDPLKPLDWAVYFYEYGKYMLPIDAGVTDSLSGNNVSYKRKVLEEVCPQYADGFFETFINESLQQQGERLYLTPLPIVYHSKPYHLKQVWSQCFHHGRHFAGRRVVGAPFINRLGRLLSSFLLPIVLLLRILRTTYRKKRHLWELWYSFPYLIGCLSIWALGEFCGYLCGEGQSHKHWV